MEDGLVSAGRTPREISDMMTTSNTPLNSEKPGLESTPLSNVPLTKTADNFSESRSTNSLPRRSSRQKNSASPTSGNFSPLNKVSERENDKIFTTVSEKSKNVSLAHAISDIDSPQSAEDNENIMYDENRNLIEQEKTDAPAMIDTGGRFIEDTPRENSELDNGTPLESQKPSLESTRLSTILPTPVKVKSPSILPTSKKESSRLEKSSVCEPRRSVRRIEKLSSASLKLLNSSSRISKNDSLCTPATDRTLEISTTSNASPRSVSATPVPADSLPDPYNEDHIKTPSSTQTDISEKSIENETQSLTEKMSTTSTERSPSIKSGSSIMEESSIRMSVDESQDEVHGLNKVNEESTRKSIGEPKSVARSCSFEVSSGDSHSVQVAKTRYTGKTASQDISNQGPDTENVSFRTIERIDISLSVSSQKSLVSFENPSFMSNDIERNEDASVQEKISDDHKSSVKNSNSFGSSSKTSESNEKEFIPRRSARRSERLSAPSLNINDSSSSKVNTQLEITPISKSKSITLAEKSGETISIKTQRNSTTSNLTPETTSVSQRNEVESVNKSMINKEKQVEPIVSRNSWSVDSKGNSFKELSRTFKNSANAEESGENSTSEILNTTSSRSIENIAPHAGEKLATMPSSKSTNHNSFEKKSVHNSDAGSQIINYGLDSQDKSIKNKSSSAQYSSNRSPNAGQKVPTVLSSKTTSTHQPLDTSISDCGAASSITGNGLDAQDEQDDLLGSSYEQIEYRQEMIPSSGRIVQSSSRTRETSSNMTREPMELIKDNSSVPKTPSSNEKSSNLNESFDNIKSPIKNSEETTELLALSSCIKNIAKYFFQKIFKNCR